MSKRICVVGAGNWGRNHIRTLNELGALGGVVESCSNGLCEVAKDYPGVACFSDLDEALKEGFDGFTVATPAQTHFEIAKAIIEAGNHVLVEKPITLAASEARELKTMAENEGVKLMVGHVLLFHPAIRKMKELIDSGKIGKVEYLYSNRLNLGTVRTEENVIWSFAPHDISIFQHFIGEMPSEVISRGGAFIQPGIHDTTMTVLTYPNNVVGHIFVSWLHPFKEHRWVVIGSDGMLSFEDSSEEKDILFYEKGINWVKGEPVKHDGPTEVIPHAKGMPLTEELKYFIDIIEGGEVELAGGQSAVEVMEVLERATESLLSDREA